MNSAWKELFGTDVGLLSLGVIVGILVIAAVFFGLLMRKIRASG